MTRNPTTVPRFAQRVRVPLFAVAAVLAVLAALAAPPAQAVNTDNFNQVQATEINLLRALVDQGVITADKAREMLRHAGIDPDLLRTPGVAAPRPPQAAPLPPSPAVAPPAAEHKNIPDATKTELFEEVRQEVAAQSRAEGRANAATLPAWLRHVNFGGDVRLRYLRNDFASDNSYASQIDSWYQLPAGTTTNAFDTHEHLQLRVRLDVASEFAEGLRAGIRLVSAGGNDATASPVDYDVELGRYGRPYSLGISLGYLQWQPLPSLQLTAGRMNNPYFKSDLIFAPELSLDGLAGAYAPQFPGGWGAFFNAGAHPLQTSQSGPFNTASDQWLYALQSGVSWTAADESRFRFGLAYYDFAGLQGKADPSNPANNGLNDASAPGFRQFGNTMFNLRYQVINNQLNAIPPLFGYAAQFRLMNLGSELEFARFDPLRLAVRFDWVRNVGFNAAQVRQRLGAAINTLPYLQNANGTTRNGVDFARTNGYLVSLRMGADMLRHAGDWQLFCGARYLQRDAVPDAFTSPDYRLGGTDNQAAFLGLNLGLSPATSVTLRYVSARSIDSAPKFGVDTWFLDLNGRF